MNKLLSSLIILLICTGCAAKLSVFKDKTFFSKERPLKVAVLPFIYKKAEDAPIAQQVREEIVANLQEGNFHIVEINETDETLNRLGLSPEKLVKAIEKAKVNLSESLGVDVVISGRILEWTKTYLALHSDVELDVQLKAYDARTGRLVAKVRKGEIKNSGISRIPTGYISVGTAPVLGLRESVQQEVIHNLTRNIVQPLLELNRKDQI